MSPCSCCALVENVTKDPRKTFLIGACSGACGIELNLCDDCAPAFAQVARRFVSKFQQGPERDDANRMLDQLAEGRR